MFNLIRRISHGVIARPDRPWAEDPTSNAPQKRKRRLSEASSCEKDDLPSPYSSSFSTNTITNGHAYAPSPIPISIPNSSSTVFGDALPDASNDKPGLETGIIAAPRGRDGEASAKKHRRDSTMDVSESGPTPIARSSSFFGSLRSTLSNSLSYPNAIANATMSSPSDVTTRDADKRRSFLGGDQYPIWGFTFGLVRSRSQAALGAQEQQQQQQQQEESEDVRAVRQGVQDVDISDNGVKPESIPLPMESDDDLDLVMHKVPDEKEESQVPGAEEVNAVVEVQFEAKQDDVQDGVQDDAPAITAPVVSIKKEQQEDDDTDVASSCNEDDESSKPAPISAENDAPATAPTTQEVEVDATAVVSQPDPEAVSSPKRGRRRPKKA